jgi:hypothetical protein
VLYCIEIDQPLVLPDTVIEPHRCVVPSRCAYHSLGVVIKDRIVVFKRPVVHRVRFSRVSQRRAYVYVTYRLAAASADFGLHLLTKSPSTTESSWPFGGGITGHHGKVNDMSFCGGRGEDSHRYVATVSGIL